MPVLLWEEGTVAGALRWLGALNVQREGERND